MAKIIDITNQEEYGTLAGLVRYEARRQKFYYIIDGKLGQAINLGSAELVELYVEKIVSSVAGSKDIYFETPTIGI